VLKLPVVLPNNVLPPTAVLARPEVLFVSA